MFSFAVLENACGIKQGTKWIRALVNSIQPESQTRHKCLPQFTKVRSKSVLLKGPCITGVEPTCLSKCTEFLMF